MGITGIWQWVVVLAIVLVLFGGRGKISQLMGDFGKGLKSFKKGINEDPDEVTKQESEGAPNTQAATTAREKEEDAAKS